MNSDTPDLGRWINHVLVNSFSLDGPCLQETSKFILRAVFNFRRSSSVTVFDSMCRLPACKTSWHVFQVSEWVCCWNLKDIYVRTTLTILTSDSFSDTSYSYCKEQICRPKVWNKWHPNLFSFYAKHVDQNSTIHKECVLYHWRVNTSLQF